MNHIDKEALFCDETESYRLPCEPDAGDRVELYFRTLRKDADAVYYIEHGNTESTKECRLTFSYCDEIFDYYETAVTVGTDAVRYSFRVEKIKDESREICFYNRMGVAVQDSEESAFCITPGFHVPEWAKGAVMYQIYVDRFCNGDVTNDTATNEYIYIEKPVQHVENWDEYPARMDVHRFYGGDLQGILDKLDYLKGLKVEALYLNPIFVSPSNHKYDCQDYDYIDPHFSVIKKDAQKLVGSEDADNVNAEKYAMRTADRCNLEASNEFFAKFVEAAHEKGIRIILDGVFNHCGSFNKWLDRELVYERQGGYPEGAYVSEESPYNKFFKFDEGSQWPHNENYEGWWGHPTLPKLNYEESPELCRYILDVAKKWVSPPYNADGWRLDVAADLGRSGEFNHGFWKDFRDAVKTANPEAVILAEHYGDPANWLKGDEWDTVMNYDAFMDPVSWFLTGMEKHSYEKNESLIGNGQVFFDAMNYHMSRMQTPSLMAAMNELSNHDHSRFMTRTNKTTGTLAESGAGAAAEEISYGVFRQGVMMCMTWPGAPTIYYGDETGMCGWTDPDNRRTFPWGRENQELTEFYRYMTGIRGRNPSLRSGSLKALYTSQGVIAYGRFMGESRCVVAVNTEEQSCVLNIPVWQIGVTESEQMCRQMLTYEEGYNAGFVFYPVRNGMLEIDIPARGSVMLAAVEE